MPSLFELIGEALQAYWFSPLSLSVLAVWEQGRASQVHSSRVATGGALDRRVCESACPVRRVTGSPLEDRRVRRSPGHGHRRERTAHLSLSRFGDVPRS